MRSVGRDAADALNRDAAVWVGKGGPDLSIDPRR
jgi:hypothetical protein